MLLLRLWSTRLWMLYSNKEEKMSEHDMLTSQDLADRTGIPVEQIYVLRMRGNVPEAAMYGRTPIWTDGPEMAAWVEANKRATGGPKGVWW